MITHRKHYSPAEFRGAISVLRPGDLLFAEPDPRGIAQLVGRRIVGLQAHYGYPPKAHEVSHVALYAGDGVIIHATPPRVETADLLTAFGGRQICIATWTVDGMSETQRDAAARDIVADARQQLGQSYQMVNCLLQVVRPLLRALWGGNPPNDFTAPLVCSTFLVDCFRHVLRYHTPLNDPTVTNRAPFVMPAHLYVQPRLIEPPHPRRYIPS